jgi:hypothetical protein
MKELALGKQSINQRRHRESTTITGGREELHNSSEHQKEQRIK